MGQLLALEELPPACVVVWQQEWTWVVQLRYQRKLLYQHWCKDFAELVGRITWYEFQFIARKKDLLTYLQVQHGARYERLSYEQAHALHQATQ